MSAELLCRMLTPLGNFQHYGWKSLTAQIDVQKFHFHPGVQGNMFVLHSLPVYLELGKSPTIENRFSSECLNTAEKQQILININRKMVLV